MKARVKATGEIVEVDFHVETKRGKLFGEVTDSKRLCKPDSTYRKFYRDEIEFLSYEDTPTFSYWERLKHQYAGMAMQGILTNEKMMLDLHRAFGKDESMDITVSEFAIDIANTLVKKLKSESNG